MVERSVLKLALESAGLRCTRQRRAVYEILGASLDHPTAEQVFHRARLREPRISLATVYKTIEALEHLGLIGRHMAPGDGRTGLMPVWNRITMRAASERGE